MNDVWLDGTRGRGQIRWHTYPAADVHCYTIRRTAAGAVVVRGTVVYRDAFKLAQRPLLFTAPMLVGPERRRAEVTWPIETFTLTEAGALAATLGTQLRGPYAPLPVCRSVEGSQALLIG